MARTWTLGGTTLPNPHRFRKETIETQATHETVTGRQVKQIRNRKYRYILGYQYLTQTEVSDILSLLNQDTTLNFSAEDGSLIISSTSVHIEVNQHDYPAKGSEFRENIDLILTEVE